MGYHICLNAKCRVLPEYKHFIEKYKYRFYDETGKITESEDVSKEEEFFLELLDIWDALGIGHSFYEFNVNENDILSIHIEKKPYHHEGSLTEDYLRFMRDIIVPITSEILKCTISHDDFNIPSEMYSDAELRNEFGSFTFPSSKLYIVSRDPSSFKGCYSSVEKANKACSNGETITVAILNQSRS